MIEHVFLGKAAEFYDMILVANNTAHCARIMGLQLEGWLLLHATTVLPTHPQGGS
jgi:hypothetical protein